MLRWFIRFPEFAEFRKMIKCLGNYALCFLCASVNKFKCWWMSKCSNFRRKQECIPIGCVPAARWPYAGVCFLGGVLRPGGVYLVLGVYLVGGVLSPGGVSGAGGCLLQGGLLRGVSAPGGVSQHALRQTPPLLTESQTPVKTLPWPNFVAAGKN